MLGGLPWPGLTPVDIHDMLRNCRKAFEKTTHNGAWMVKKHFDGQAGIVAGAGPWHARIKIVLLESYIRRLPAILPRMGQLIETQAQSRDLRLRELFRQQLRDAPKATTNLQKLMKRNAAGFEDIEQEPFLHAVIILRQFFLD